MSDAAGKNPELVDKDKKREILELKVNELSVVDRPAILREFLVVKRLQEEPMGTFKEEGQSTGTEVEKALPADLKSAITAVSGWLGKNKDAEGAPGDAIAKVVAFLGKIAEGKYPYPSPSGVSKAGKPEDEMTDDEKKKKEEEAKAKAGKPEDQMTDDEKKKKEEEAKKKSADSDALSIKVSPSGEVTVSGTSITKGKSQFTDDRTTSLSDAVNKLIGMLADVDKSAAQGIVEGLLKGQLPGEVKWTQATQATDASVKKSLEEVLAPLTAKVEGLTTKVEAIEKSRPAPKSETGDATVQTGVTKSSSTWDGLPLPRG